MRSVSDLILAVQDRISIGLDDEDRWNRAAVVRAMNECVQEQVAPKLIQEGGEYLVHRLVVPLLRNGLPAYPNLRVPLPNRIYGRALRDVKYVTDQGDNEFKVWDEINVTFTSVAEADSFERREFSYRNPMVCLVNDYIRVLGDPQSAQGALVLYYNLEISKLVDKTTEFAAITNATYNTITSTATFTASTGTEYGDYQSVSSLKLVDLYRAATGAIIKPNVKMTRTSSTTFTTTDLTQNEFNELANYQEGLFPVAPPYDTNIYIVPAKQCQFSTIPEAFDSILVLETCSRILESLGDTQALEVNAQMLTKAYNSISISMGNRISGQQKRVTDNRSIASFQRRAGNWFGRRF